MKVFQLLDRNGNYVALFGTEKTDEEEIDQDFEDCLSDANADKNVDDTLEGAIELLKKRGIKRIYVDEISTNWL